MIVLVCGGRKYSNHIKINDTLNKLSPKPKMIIQGGASGADAIAAKWAFDNDIHCVIVYAVWSAYGKMAGQERNAVMILLKPDLVIAFPGGSGTADMVARARAIGTSVKVVE